MARPIPDLDEMSGVEVATDDQLIIDDSSAGQTKRIKVSELLALPDFGWIPAGETWSYVSWDSARRIGIVSVPSDATTKYTLGNRVRIQQVTGGVKYGLIHKIEATQLTIHFPAGISLANQTISSPSWSPLDTPIGFPRSKKAWEVRFVTSSTTSNASPNGSLWYNTGSPLLALGPGSWHAIGRPAFKMSSSGAAQSFYTALSDSSSTSNFEEATSRDYVSSGRGAPALFNHCHILDIEKTSNFTLYIIYKSGGSFDNRGDTSGPQQTTIVAYSGYL